MLIEVLMKPFYNKQRHAFSDLYRKYEASSDSSTNIFEEIANPNLFQVSSFFGACSENMVDNSNVVVNEATKEDLIALADALIKSVEQQ